MLNLVLGIVIGLLLAIIWILLSNKPLPEPSKLVETIKTSAKRRQRGEILIPEDEQKVALEKKIKEKHDAGLDVFLDEIDQL